MTHATRRLPLPSRVITHPPPPPQTLFVHESLRPRARARFDERPALRSRETKPTRRRSRVVLDTIRVDTIRVDVVVPRLGRLARLGRLVVRPGARAPSTPSSSTSTSTSTHPSRRPRASPSAHSISHRSTTVRARHPSHRRRHHPRHRHHHPTTTTTTIRRRVASPPPPSPSPVLVRASTKIQERESAQDHRRTHPTRVPNGFPSSRRVPSPGRLVARNDRRVEGRPREGTRERGRWWVVGGWVDGPRVNRETDTARMDGWGWMDGCIAIIRSIRFDSIRCGAGERDGGVDRRGRVDRPTDRAIDGSSERASDDGDGGDGDGGWRRGCEG